MKYKECIKRVGIKNVILYEIFYVLEIIINSPYFLLRGIGIVYDNILEVIVFLCKKQQVYLASIFEKRRLINLSTVSRKIDNFRIETIKKLQDKED